MNVLTPKYLFLAQRGELYRLGFTSNIEKRIAQMRRTPGPKVVLRHTATGRWVPRTKHLLKCRFCRQQVEGEWFRLTKEDVALIQSVKVCDGTLPEALRPRLPDTAINVPIRADVLNKLKKLATAANRTVGQEVLALIERHVEQVVVTPDDQMESVDHDAGVDRGPRKPFARAPRRQYPA